MRLFGIVALLITFPIAALNREESRLTGTASDGPDFARQIAPILERRCFRCHRPDVRKGKLSLASRQDALKGGRKGPAFVPGDSKKSKLLELVSTSETGEKPA